MSEVNENVTVNGAGTQDEEPAAKNNETKAEKFIRLGEYRMNKAIDAIGRLEHMQSKEEIRNEIVRKRNCGKKQAEHDEALAVCN